MYKLTDRQAQLLKIMSDEPSPRTYTALGEQLGVSARTVMRELDACGGYLKDADVALERIASGSCLTGTQEALEALREALGKKMYVANPEQRLNLLKLELLQSSDPVKLYSLSRKLGVAESTVSHDLDKTAAWLEGYALRLTRRQGFGVLLEGGEADRRSALAGLIYDSLGDALLVRWLAGEERLQQRLKEAFLPAWVDAATAAEIAARLGDLQYKDTHLSALALHLLIIVGRVRAGWACAESETDACGDLPEYGAAEQIARYLEERFAVRLPWAEVCCIAMHLHQRSDAFAQAQRERAAELAQEFLLDVWEASGFSFVYDEHLMEAVTQHLGAALQRIRLRLKIRNPLEKEIKEYYADNFAVTRRALAGIERREGLKVPDAEAAYLTMYLLAALAAGAPEEKKIFHAVVCCPHGMSSAVLLTSRLRATYQNIVVDDMVSTTQLAEVSAADLILSTVACTSERAEVLTVSPLLTDADQKKIDAWIDGRRPKRRAQAAPSERNWQDRLVQINAFSEEMIRFLCHVFFVSCDAVNREDLIACAAAAIVGGNREAIVAALWEREKRGSVLVEEQQLLFLHARTDAVDTAHFGVLRPRSPIFVGGKPIQTAVAMLIPLQATRSQVELLQKFTALIAEDAEFQLLLRRCTEEELQTAAEQICKRYFKEKFME